MKKKLITLRFDSISPPFPLSHCIAGYFQFESDVIGGCLISLPTRRRLDKEKKMDVEKKQNLEDLSRLICVYRLYF